MKKILLIIPYFGEWPFWFNLFLFSVKNNKTVNFLFYTDCIPPPDIDNIKTVKISFAEYCRKASAKLGICFKPDLPIKLCDLKPFYGYIHEEEIKNYDFYGFCDLDLIFGNIRNIITDVILDKYDYISTHSDRISGHFFLIRNNKNNINLCFKIKNWKQYLEDNKLWVIDEALYTDAIIGSSHFRKIQRLRNPIVSIPLVRKSSLESLYRFLVYFARILFRFKAKKIFFCEMFTTPSIFNDKMEFMYNNGILININTRRELIYLHFLRFKFNEKSTGLWYMNNQQPVYTINDENKIIYINKRGIFQPDDTNKPAGSGYGDA